MMGSLNGRKLNRNRSSAYIRYAGTKHDGNRRIYGTSNPINYFSVCEFIEGNFGSIQRKIERSSLSISAPRLGGEADDRSIIVPSLSELSSTLSTKIRYSPYVLKTDISQFFGSIYTHAIPWVAHGRDKSKADRDPKSSSIKFNQLDWFCQQCQNGQTRGVIVGPDAFRLVAEFIASEVDNELTKRSAGLIVGAVRHVDDYYIGVRAQVDATIILSHLRDILQDFELQLNDSKTRIISGMQPVDDLWAQDLRSLRIEGDVAAINRGLDAAYEASKKINSESPMKLMLRRIDRLSEMNLALWQAVEPKLQRVIHHFPHCIDYICLLVVKRYARGLTIDTEGWREAVALLLKDAISFNHHHELAWMIWMMLLCDISINESLMLELSTVHNSHIKALIIAAYSKGRIATRPRIGFSNRLTTTDESWLHNLVARSCGFSKASFGGALNDEFEHLASRSVVLIDFDRHFDQMARDGTNAISETRYGYDSDAASGDDDDDDDDDEFIDYEDGLDDEIPW